MIRRVLLVLCGATLATTTVVAAGPATAQSAAHDSSVQHRTRAHQDAHRHAHRRAQRHQPRGYVTSARLNTWTNRLTVHGWAYDPDAAHRSVGVRVRTGQRPLAHVRAARPSRGLDRSHHIRGHHRFVLHMKVIHNVRKLRVLSAGLGRGGRVKLDRHHVRHVHTAPGHRVVDVAKRYVGKVGYRYGGSSPRSGFDCSGYTMWVYQHAHVRQLPHSAQAQRRLHALHRIKRRNARPGDLIFYLDHGYAYHVAIFGGHGTDYAATEPGQKIQHQPIHGRNLVFKTLR